MLRPAMSRTPAPPPQPLLLVDGDARALTERSRLFEEAGYLVVGATDGTTAISLAHNRHPALILTTVVLPDMSGVALVTSLREDPGLAHTWIVLLRPSGELVDSQAVGLDAGADGYIAGPLTDPDLVARVRLYLRQRDLTEQLRETEQQFGGAFEHANIGMAVVAPGGQFQQVNPALCRMLGYTADELMRLSFQEITHPEDRGASVDSWGALLAGDISSIALQKRYLNRAGDAVWTDVTVSAVRDELGRPLRQIAQMQDLTQRKLHEAEIARLNRLYASLSQVAHVVARTPARLELFRTVCRILVDHGGFRLAWIGWHNPQAQRLVPVAHAGDDEGRLASLHFETGDGHPQYGPAVSAFREGQAQVSNDIHRDPGAAHWGADADHRGYRALASFPLHLGRRVRGTLSVYHDEPGVFQTQEVALLTEVAGDVSFALHNLRQERRRRRAEVVLRETQERLTSALSAGAIGTWTWDVADGRIVADAVTARLFAIDPMAATRGLPPADYLRAILPEDRPPVETALDRAIQSCGAYDVEYRVPQPDGSMRWLQAKGRVLPDAARQAATFHGAVMDVTDRKMAEASSITLQRNLNVAEAADRVKSVFLATMSHELRTPLNSIIGFTGIILQGLAGPLTGEQTTQLTMVEDSAQHLLALINDVLDLSKIEAGQFVVRPEPFDLAAVLRHAVSSIEPVSTKKQLWVTTTIAPEVGTINSDRRRVEQIVLNLLSNAVKFTDRGGVSVHAETLAGVPPHIRIAISDTGVGIKPRDLDRLFQPFSQIETGLARSAEGTGLGLAISRRLATLLGGRLSAASEWQRGSTFTLTLPVSPGIAS